MISLVQPIPAGNALRLFVEPDATATRWRILRKASDSFSGHSDPSALVVMDGTEVVFVDSTSLPNDVMAFYKPYYTADGVTWSAGATVNGTPSATYVEQSTDVLSKLRERLEAGLKVECDRGNFATENGYIQVINATPSLDGGISFPLVIIHVENEDPSVRGIGEDVLGDDFIDFTSQDGWIEDVRLTVIGWSLNADERNELRKAIRRVVLANMTVFADLGWQQVSLSLADIDAVSGEYAAPMFQVMGTFTCLAPVVVTGAIGDSIETVISGSLE